MTKYYSLTEYYISRFWYVKYPNSQKYFFLPNKVTNKGKMKESLSNSIIYSGIMNVTSVIINTVILNILNTYKDTAKCMYVCM